MKTKLNKLKWQLSSSGKSLMLTKSIDVLIVVVGVTIAFQLNNLKQRSDQKSLEHFYLESLAVDLDKDINAINHILSELRSDSTLTNTCLSRHTSGTVSLDTLSFTVVSILSFETFNYRNDNTYTTLMNSHGLNIINNKLTRNLISEYYKCYKSIDRFEYVYTEFLLNDFHPYFSSNVDYASGKISNSAILKDGRTNNRLLIAGGQLNDGIATYKNALANASELRRILVEE
jgi:hypothetical protein